MHHAPLQKKAKGLFDHYEASYYDFVVSLTRAEPVTDELLLNLLKFRIYKNAFYSELLKTSAPGMVTYLKDGEQFFKTAIDARCGLLELFPEHAGHFDKAIDSPMAFLPFIKLSEDPFSDILGQTMKLGPEHSLIAVKSGTGRELPTAMHENLHAAVRGLPGAFEEGFCRYALQSRGIEPDEMISLHAHEDATIRANFGGIFYPNLLVNILAQALGDRKVTGMFFGEDGLEAFLRKIGKSMEDVERPFHRNDHLGAIAVVRDLGAALGPSLSAGLKAVIERVAAAGANQTPG